MSRQKTLQERQAEAQAELRPGQSAELLKELHILTRDGVLNADSRRKLKQVNHLCQLIEPALKDLFAKEGAGPEIVDVGAGKSYLGFLLYDGFVGPKGRGRIWGLEARQELVERSAALALKLGFDRMKFIGGEAARAGGPEKVDLVTALHACDTATDDAIDLALGKKADWLALVPCCQAELAQALRASKDAQSKAQGAWPALWAQPLHRREFGSHLTNVLRCMRLEASGYQVTVTELVGWEHSLKNELILARKMGPPLPERVEKLRAFLLELGLGAVGRRFEHISA